MESGSRLYEFASSFHHNIPPYRVSRHLDGAKASGAASQTGGDRRSEVIDPASNGLVGDRDPALSEQFDVSKAQRKPDGAVGEANIRAGPTVSTL